VQTTMCVRMYMGKRAREGGSEGTRGKGSKSSKLTRMRGEHKQSTAINRSYALCACKLQVARSERLAVRAGTRRISCQTVHPPSPNVYTYTKLMCMRTPVISVSCACAYAHCTYIYNAQRSRNCALFNSSIIFEFAHATLHAT
jgi:hypothetical protein